MNKLRFRGDTIIEVLISITVVSVILGGAYASSNRSLSATRQAQERGESLKLAEEQLERLKTVARLQPTILNETEPFFCIKEDLTYTKFTSMPDLHEFNDYDEECAQQPHGGTEYLIGVERTGVGSFVIHSTWYRSNGQGDDHLELVYRLYPSSTVPVTAPPCPGSPGCGSLPAEESPTTEPRVELSVKDDETVVDPGDRVTLVWTTPNGPFEYCDAEASFEQANHRNWNGRLDDGDVSSNGGEERTGNINDRTTFRIECWKDGVRKRDSVTVRVRTAATPGTPTSPSSPGGPTGGGGPATPGEPGDVCGISTYFAHPGPVGHGHEGGDAVGGDGGDGSGGDACTGDAGSGGDGGSSAPGGDGRPSAPSAPTAPSAPSSSTGTVCSTRNGVKTCTDL